MTCTTAIPLVIAWIANKDQEFFTFQLAITNALISTGFTPPPALGPVIIAGDTIVRSWSFLVSALTLFVFELHSLWGISFEIQFFLVNILPCGSIFAPKWSLLLARKYASSHQIDIHKST